MRILCAMLKHETNTFSPIPTDLARFEDWGLQYGADVVAAYRDTRMPLAAYFRLAEAQGAEIVTPVAAEAMPAGLVTAQAYDHLTQLILDEVARGCDVALLDLHGAMVAEGVPDGEGTLLRKIRELAPDLPIAVTCDLHCNLTAEMVENCTALIGYKTYPHIDMYEVADQVGQIVMAAANGGARPVMAWGQVPLLSQTLRQGTDDSPMREIIARCHHWESQDGIGAATVFGGFALSDIEDAGTSAVVIADQDAFELAEVARDDLLMRCWAAREDFVYQPHDLGAAVSLAKGYNAGPVILLDHADNCGSGATQDVMTVIAEVLRQDLQDVAVATVWDPDAVSKMQKAGLGATVTLDLGGKTAMPSLDLTGKPLTVTGVVEHVSDGRFIVEGPMYTGVEVHCGPTALLRVAGVRLIVTSLHHEPWDTGVFSMMGIDPTQTKYLLLKSRIHYRAGFGDLARHTLTLDGEGVTTSDNAKLNYTALRRPIYPLDEDIEWSAGDGQDVS
jgi:microcystin degradation protein MlrC